MLMLVTGGSGSGKSEYAEGIAVSLAEREGLPLYYIAAMKPYGEEGKRRVERHRRLRAGKGFQTVERYVALKGQELPEEGVVLLECLSNLTANEMFEPEGAGDGTEEAVLAGVEALSGRSRHLVVVTNDIFSDGITYDEVTGLYQERLGHINRELAARAEQVTEVVCGIPLQLKKEGSMI